MIKIEKTEVFGWEAAGFIDWIRSLPYSELIMMGCKNEQD